MEDDQQFCLRWNNHQSTLIQNFDTLLESGTLVDCTLAAEGKYLKAHKVVLSACSPYFEGLLSEHYDKHPVFILKDVKFKELKAMMDYMYRGEVNISQDQLTALLKAAESLQIKGLSDSRTGGTGGATTGKADTRPAKTASLTAATSSSVDIPHASSGLTIEKNSKVPRQSLQQATVSDLPEDSASPQLRGLSSREGSQSPTRKRKRLRRRSLGNEDTTNSMDNHEASNSSDVNINAPALGVAPIADDKSHADPADSIGRSALMQQLTKPADEMLQIPIEKPEPSEEMIQPKSEYLDDQESVEDLTNLDDDMNDLNEMEQDNSRAGPSHDPSQHPGIASWHIAGDRSNTNVGGAAAGPPGAQDEVFLAAHEAAQAQRDSQGLLVNVKTEIDEAFVIDNAMNFEEEFFNHAKPAIKTERDDFDANNVKKENYDISNRLKVAQEKNLYENMELAEKKPNIRSMDYKLKLRPCRVILEKVKGGNEVVLNWLAVGQAKEKSKIEDVQNLKVKRSRGARRKIKYRSSNRKKNSSVQINEIDDRSSDLNCNCITSKEKLNADSLDYKHKLRSCRVVLDKVKNKKNDMLNWLAVDQENKKPVDDVKVKRAEENGKVKYRIVKGKDKKIVNKGECICDIKLENEPSTPTKLLKKCFVLYDFSCPHCDFVTERSNDGKLLDHIKRKHRNCDVFGRAKVKYCPKYMNRLKKLRKCRKLKTSFLQCSWCPGTYSNPTSFKNHCCLHRYTCIWCPYSSSKRLDMRAHVTKH